MMIFLWVLGIGIIGFLLLAVYCALVLAGRADEQTEKLLKSWEK